eukprot:TRINITY_DN2074_c0_g1_i12.p2 TRINITY_DN2074_c0_g1~~TRINITY_DN2074_c0_g1_i12.p2  ORF type:complete len:273 (+),score=51.46 TRINITY_DN2074_c0_g1_i12:163-981(+)
MSSSMSLESVPNILQELGEIYQSVPLFTWILAGHCFFAVGLAPQLKHNFLMHYWATFLGGFAGGIVSSLLIMDPKQAPLAILNVNSVAIVFTVCWWLRTYAPFGIVDRILKFLPFAAAVKAMSNFMKVQVIVSQVNLAVRLYPGVVISPLLLGTLAGTSGKLVLDLIFHSQQIMAGPPEVVAPTFILRSGFMVALSYYLLTHVFYVLPGVQAMALITTFYVVHGIMQDVSGMTLDVTYPVAKLAHVVSLVPEPTYRVEAAKDGNDGNSKKNK